MQVSLRLKLSCAKSSLTFCFLFSIVTTTRKFFTVLFSVFFMGNPMQSPVRQWIATVVVFAALFADAVWGKKQLFGKKPQPVPTEDPDLEKKGQLAVEGTKLEDVELEELNSKK